VFLSRHEMLKRLIRKKIDCRRNTNMKNSKEPASGYDECTSTAVPSNARYTLRGNV